MSFTKTEFIPKKTAITAGFLNSLQDTLIQVESDVSDKVSFADLTEELAKRGQLAPEFANTVGECTDTTKLYVLPDGHIYAYMTQTGPLFTNQLTKAVDTDGTPYADGAGYVDGKSFYSVVNNVESAKPYSECVADSADNILTGLIPYNQANTIRVSGFTGDLTSFDYLVFFDGNLNTVIQTGRLTNYVNTYGQTYADEAAFGGAVKTFTLDRTVLATKTGYWANSLANAKYVALSSNHLDADRLVITFDEEIAYGTSSQWRNTGHAFVPADYESRIIPLEEAEADHEARIKALEVYGGDSVSDREVPAYIKAECDDVIARVIDKQGNRSFNLIALSDFHYYNYGDSQKSLIRACKAISYLQSRMHFDAVATLGDNVPCGEGTAGEVENAHRWMKMVNEALCMTEAAGVRQFRTPGNHDRVGGDTADGSTPLFMPDNAIYSYISGYSRDCVMGDVPGGYGYCDFDSYKLRVILVNTSECEGKGRFSTYSGFHISTKQVRWLIDTLDLSGKDDGADWQILILSHHRADDYQEPIDGDGGNYIFPNILNAYAAGGSYSATRTEDGETISCDFAGKNAAKLIGQIHGHHHNYKFGNLYLGAPDHANSVETNVMAVGTPTTQLGADNPDNDGNTYVGTLDTATETAFCVYCIDLDDHVIHAVHYGAGLDREIGY